MKKYFIISLVAIAFIACNVHRKDTIADDNAKMMVEAMKDSTSVQIIDTTYNFGKVVDGNKVEYNYRFKNIGTKPLVVTNTTASCGCTVPQKPEKPILPGDIGFIKVVFDSKGRVGEAHKTITVTSNAKPSFPELILMGEVIKEQ